MLTIIKKSNESILEFWPAILEMWKLWALIEYRRMLDFPSWNVFQGERTTWCKWHPITKGDWAGLVHCLHNKITHSLTLKFTMIDNLVYYNSKKEETQQCCRIIPVTELIKINLNCKSSAINSKCSKCYKTNCHNSRIVSVVDIICILVS